jgi:hypothetical protein
VRRRSLALGACCSFLAGIGATAVAAWFQLQWQNRHELNEVTDLEARLTNERSWTEAAREEARQGRHHVESLLRTPTVSETDRLTDISAARAWLRKMKEVD